MPLFARPTAPATAPTFEERLNGANAQAAAAVSVFEMAAADLDHAAAEAAAVAADIREEMQSLLTLREAATDTVTQAATRADAFRSALGL